MGFSSLTLYSTQNPLGIHSNHKISARHFNKHLVCNRETPITLPKNTVNLSYLSPLLLNSTKTKSTYLVKPLKCAFNDNPSSNFQNFIYFNKLGNFSYESLSSTLLNLTPLNGFKWLSVVVVAIAVVKWAVNLVFNPFFWMYFSWTWLFWPWFVAIACGVCGIYSYVKHSRGEARVVEQLGIVTSVIMWLTLVPPAFFNGFLEGWPVVFFFVYHYFFFFNVSIRKRLYGDYYPRPHDSKWDVNVPVWYRALFAVGVMVGHWFAAFEGPELHLISGGWSNVWVWGLIMITLFSHYNASSYLAKYLEKVVVPTSVVQFGPYRWVRHPIYASTMLLFLWYFVALRAPISSLFMVAVCVIYYNQKAKLEEALMIDTFGERYREYMSKVRYKFIPFAY